MNNLLLVLSLIFCTYQARAVDRKSRYACDEFCFESLREFSHSSLLKLQGKSLLLPADAFASPDPQKIFFLDSLQKPQVDIVQNLASFSLDPKIVATERNIEHQVDQVEVGAFRVVLKNGREIVERHTSQEPDAIEEEQISSSWERILNTKGFQMSEVVLIEYYHTHPWVGSMEGGLSSFDAHFITDWLTPKIKKLNHGFSPPINLYAISQTLDKYLFVYESSY